MSTTPSVRTHVRLNSRRNYRQCSLCARGSMYIRTLPLCTQREGSIQFNHLACSPFCVRLRAYPSNTRSTDTEPNCVQILEDNLPQAKFKRLSTTSRGIINVWRPLKTVHRDPLCLCDARTVSSEFPHMVILPSKGSGAYDSFLDKATFFELLKVSAAPEHKWYYASLVCSPLNDG
jgi:hypothetical protein